MKIGGVNTIDFARVSRIPKFRVNVKSGDSKRVISLVLLENNIPINLNNYTVAVAAVKSDGSNIFNDVKIVDALAGVCEVEVTEQMLATNLDFPCELVLYGADGTVASSSNFVISRISNIRNEESIVSSSEFTALTKALSDVTKVKRDISKKADKDEVFSMSNMGQDIKEAMTGGSVAVVGVNTILKDNIVKKQIVPSKFSKISIVSNNLIDIDDGTYGYFIDHTTGNLRPELSEYPMWTTGYIEVEEGETYFRGATRGYSAWYDNAYNFISGINQHTGNEFIVAPTNACYFRTSTTKGSINTLCIIRSNKQEIIDEYAYEFNSLKVNPLNLIGNIPNGKLEFNINEYSKLIVGKNKFNKDTATIGYYISDTTGNLVKEASGYPFSASDFIYVESGESYSRHKNKASKTDPMAFYDKDKKFISGGRLSNPFIVPDNACYIRVSVPTPDLDLYQVEIGSMSDYENYSYVIPLENIPNHRHSKEDIDGLDSTGNGEMFELNLPKDIYVAIGYPLEIYNKHVCYCGNINNFHFKWNLSSGKNMGRKLVITPSDSLNGKTEQLTLEVYSNDLSLVATARATVHYLKPSSSLSPLSNKKILCIGDSLTDISKWRDLLNTRLNSEIGNKFEFIGTLGGSGLRHEGHSGWSINSYMTGSTEGWNGDYKIKVSDDIGAITPKKEYKFGTKIFEFEKKEIENGSTWLYFNRISGGGYVDPNQTAVEVTNSVSGVSQIPYTEVAITSINPFYNPITSKFDANYYSDNLGSVPDYCILWLGANGVNSSLDKVTNYNDAATKVNNLKTIIDNILSSCTSCKLFVCFNHYWANQTGLGNAGGVTYLDKGIDLGVFNTNRHIKTIFENYNNRLVLVPVGHTHDSEYNYPYKEVGVNNRNDQIKTIEYTDRVHPNQSSGFIQFADTIYGTVINNL